MIVKNKLNIENYQLIIDNVDLLSMKMEAISQELFDANIEFIAKLNELSPQQESGFKYFDKTDFGLKVQNLLDNLEEQTRFLKREKIHYQFKKGLLKEPLV